MNMKTLKAWAATAAMMALSGTAQAGLVLQPNGVEVLDTDTNLLWLYDWSSSGGKNWADAKTWAAGLTVGGATAGDWRLPEIGEYADLWTDPDVGSSLSGLQSKFTGVLTRGFYWSGTEFAPNTGFAWYFGPNVVGNQFWAGKLDALSAVAVRPGNVTLTLCTREELVSCHPRAPVRTTRPAIRCCTWRRRGHRGRAMPPAMRPAALLPGAAAGSGPGRGCTRPGRGRGPAR